MTIKQTYSVPKYRLSLVKDGTAAYAERHVEQAEQAARVIGTMLNDEPVENIVVLYLNSRNKIVGAEIVSRGGLHGCAVTMAEIYRGAIVKCASAIILGHNHPSGDPRPSEDDVRMTRQAAEAGKMIGIKLLDHVVVTRETHGGEQGLWHSIRHTHAECF